MAAKEEEKRVPKKSGGLGGLLSDMFSRPTNVAWKAGALALLGVGVACTENLSSKRGLVYEHELVDPKPERFDIDPLMAQYFHKVHVEFRKWDDASYRRALENTDRLFLQEKAIEKRGPRHGDKKLAQMFAVQAGIDLLLLCKRIQDPAAKAKFTVLGKAMLGRLHKHYKNVVRIVSVIYPPMEFLKTRDGRYTRRNQARAAQESKAPLVDPAEAKKAPPTPSSAPSGGGVTYQQEEPTSQQEEEPASQEESES